MDRQLAKVEIGRRIAERREAVSMTRAELARQIHVDPSRLLRIERGLEQPTIVQVAMLATALRCGMDDLIAEVPEHA